MPHNAMSQMPVHLSTISRPYLKHLIPLINWSLKQKELDGTNDKEHSREVLGGFRVAVLIALNSNKSNSYPKTPRLALGIYCGRFCPSVLLKLCLSS